MKIVNYNGQTYYCNGAKPTDEEYKQFSKRGKATEEVEYFLANRRINFFHGHKLTNGFDDLQWCGQLFDTITQPTEKEVRHAMIKLLAVNTGDGISEKYYLKAGGGSKSDSIFSSSLSMITSDPKTGYDKWVTVMTKYSTVFSDVLITYEELVQVMTLSASKEQIERKQKDEALDEIGFLLRSYRTGKFHFTTGVKPLNLDKTVELIARFKKNKSNELLGSVFDYIHERINQSLLQEFKDDPLGDHHRKHIALVEKDIQNLDVIRELYSLNSVDAKKINQVKKEFVQTSLF